MSAFIVIGAIFAVIGLTLLVIAIRNLHLRQPKHVAMLIGGMMAAAFGVVLAGFAIAWNVSAPLALNAAQPTP